MSLEGRLAMYCLYQVLTHSSTGHVQPQESQRQDRLISYSTLTACGVVGGLNLDLTFSIWLRMLVYGILGCLIHPSYCYGAIHSTMQIESLLRILLPQRSYIGIIPNQRSYEIVLPANFLYTEVDCTRTAGFKNGERESQSRCALCSPVPMLGLPKPRSAQHPASALKLGVLIPAQLGWQRPAVR